MLSEGILELKPERHKILPEQTLYNNTQDDMDTDQI